MRRMPANATNALQKTTNGIASYKFQCDPLFSFLYALRPSTLRIASLMLRIASFYCTTSYRRAAEKCETLVCYRVPLPLVFQYEVYREFACYELICDSFNTKCIANATNCPQIWRMPANVCECHTISHEFSHSRIVIRPWSSSRCLICLIEKNNMCFWNLTLFIAFNYSFVTFLRLITFQNWFCFKLSLLSCIMWPNLLTKNSDKKTSEFCVGCSWYLYWSNRSIQWR